MVLHCIEIKFIGDDKYYHLCVIKDNNNKINKLDNIYNPKENTYCFDIQYALFDNLSEEGIKYLEHIFENIKNDGYINKNKWEFYKDKNMYNYYDDGQDVFIEPKQNISIPIFDFGKVDSRTTDRRNGKTIFYVNDGLGNVIPYNENEYNKKGKTGRKKIKKARFVKSTNDLKNLCKNLQNIYSKKNMDLYIEDVQGYEVIVGNDVELIHAFLDMVFLFQVGFILRPCELCKQYFITETGAQKRCGRKYKDDKTCAEYGGYIKKKYGELSKISSLENRVRSFTYNSRQDEYDRYEREHKLKKEILTKKEYVSWLLDFYVDNNRKQAAIDKLELFEYLD